MRIYPTAAFRKRLLWVGFLVLGVPLVAYFGVLVPFKGWLQDHRRVQDRLAEHQALAQKISEKKILEALDDSLRSELQTIEGQLRNYHNQQVYLREIDQISSSNNLSLEGVQVVDKGDRIHVSFQLEGRFRDLIKTCYELESHSMPTKINTLRMVLVRNKIQLQIQVLIQLLNNEN